MIFKIRCSAIHHIMGKKALGKTGESYCETWLKEQLYNRSREFSSKYTEKGTLNESGVLDRLGLKKNERTYENDFLQGTPDAVGNFVHDVKCSWDAFTFPLFDDQPDSDYVYQLQGYMCLTGLKKAKLHYVLTDTPETIIESEARRQSYKLGHAELDADLYDEVLHKMTYSEIPDELKIKSYDILYDTDTINLIRNRVVECRIYINSLLDRLAERNTFMPGYRQPIEILSGQ